MFTENKTTELKREYVDDIKNTAIAFANCDGGTLYVGIENDGTVRGVEDADGTMLRVTNAIRDAVRPDLTMFLECRCETMEGKPVICVRVQRGTARPYYLHSKGIRPEGVFVRQGASTVPASEAAILDMIKETSGDSYEAARSLGLTAGQTTWLVVIPQALRKVTPALMNDFISMQKDVGLISVLGAVDAVRAAQIEVASSYNFTPYVVASLLFILMSVPFILLSDWYSERLRRREQSGGVV